MKNNEEINNIGKRLNEQMKLTPKAKTITYCIGSPYDGEDRIMLRVDMPRREAEQMLKQMGSQTS